METTHFRLPFLLRNIPKQKHNDVIDDINQYQIMELKRECEFYKSIFETHSNSAVFNLHIKTINGQKVWVDRIRELDKLQLLDKDKEVIEWLKPVRCER